MTKDWIDSALEAGATLDWITPTLSILSGRPTLAVPMDDMVDTRVILADAGIDIHLERIFDGRYVFDVAPADLDRAIALLGYQKRQGCGYSWFWTLMLVLFVAAVVVALGAI